MDYLILGFLALIVILYMFFKAKLALLDADSKYNTLPPGYLPENMQNRYGSGSAFTLFLVFGAVLLIFYTLIRTGRNSNAHMDYLLTEVLSSDTDSEQWERKTYKSLKKAEIARSRELRAAIAKLADLKKEVARFENQMNSLLEVKFDSVEQIYYFGGSSGTEQKNFARQVPYDGQVNRTRIGTSPFDDTSRAKPFLLNVSAGNITVDPYAREVPLGGDYWLQIVSLSSEKKAFEIAEYYQDFDSLEARVVPENGMYKVRLGPFSDRSSARTVREKYQGSWFIVED